MATQHGQLTIGWIDSYGVKCSTNIPVAYDDTATLSAIMTLANTIVADGIALSEDAVTEVTMRVTLPNPGPLTPTADSNSSEGLLINMNQTTIPYPQEIWFPALIDALLVNGKIDLTNATLVQFVADITTAGVVRGSSKSFYNLVSLRDGGKNSRGLKRQSLKKTKSEA